jgi:cadmium resistance protein CadD (predicted permease)
MPYVCSVGADTIALSIPILAVCGGVLIAITAIIVNGRKKEQEHRERLVAMEKGLTPPPPPVEVERPKYSSRRANGLVMTGIGLALTIAMTIADGPESGCWGLIPLFIGIGLLVAGAIDKREYDERQRAERNTRTNQI